VIFCESYLEYLNIFSADSIHSPDPNRAVSGLKNLWNKQMLNYFKDK